MTEKDLIIQDLRRENAELRARVQEWISVDDRLPENIANRVLVVCERSNGVFYAHYEKPFWINLETDKRGNIKADTQGAKAYQTSCEKVFAAGDGRKGQSLVVYAIAEGRQCAKAVDDFLNRE